MGLIFQSFRLDHKAPVLHDATKGAFLRNGCSDLVKALRGEGFVVLESDEHVTPGLPTELLIGGNYEDARIQGAKGRFLELASGRSLPYRSDKWYGEHTPAHA